MTHRARDLTLTALLLAASTAWAADWSSYRTLTSSNGIRLEFKTKDKSSGGTDIKFRCTNTGSQTLWPSVVDKVYRCADGSTDRASDESCGTTRLEPGETSSTVPDYSECEGHGGIRYVEAALKIREP